MGESDQVVLERLFARAATDPAERPAFIRALLASNVIVLGKLVDRDVSGPGPGQEAMLVYWSDDIGPIYPFFTSEALLRRTIDARPGTDPDFLRLRCRDYFEMVRGKRLVLNPDGASAKVFLPTEIDAYLAEREPGVTKLTLPKDRQVVGGPATSMPAELPEVLSRYLAKRPVSAAHLGWISEPGGHEGYALVLVTTDEAAAMEGFGVMQIDEFTGGHDLDVIVVPPGRDHVLMAIPPFYVREPLS